MARAAWCAPSPAYESTAAAARIIAVADAWDAMTNKRPYSEAQTTAQAREELVRCAGTQFDPVVVEAFCGAVEAA